MCGFYPFFFFLSYPLFSLPPPEWTWVSFSLTLSFIHIINISYAIFFSIALFIRAQHRVIPHRLNECVSTDHYFLVSCV